MEGAISIHVETESKPLKDISVVLSQSEVPDYRVKLFDQLADEIGPGFALVTDVQASAYKGGAPDFAVAARDIGVAGRRMWWQVGGVRDSISADVAVLTLNPRILSNLFILMVRNLKHRPTLLWGHVWSRSGSSSNRNFIRTWMMSRATGVIAYSDEQRFVVARLIGEKRAFAAPNAIASRTEIVEATGARTDFVVAGRLIEEKRPDIALRAFALVLPAIDPTAKLVFVGDGPLRVDLADLAESLGVLGRVRFEGEVFDRSRLRLIFGDALCSLATGTVGLSITQSVGFGIPLLYSRQPGHGPELEMVASEMNSVLADGDSSEEFAEKLIEVSEQAAMWRARGSAIAEDCRKRCSIEAMIEGFLEAVEVARRSGFNLG